jgi:hypothetical protein
MEVDISGLSGSSKCTACDCCDQYAVSYCTECKEYLCTTIHQAHKKAKKTKDHRTEGLLKTEDYVRVRILPSSLEFQLV